MNLLPQAAYLLLEISLAEKKKKQFFTGKLDTLNIDKLQL